MFRIADRFGQFVGAPGPRRRDDEKNPLIGTCRNTRPTIAGRGTPTAAGNGDLGNESADVTGITLVRLLRFLLTDLPENVRYPVTWSLEWRVSPMTAHLRLIEPCNENRQVAPGRQSNASLRPREYLTPAEVDRLMKAARDGRYGHRDGQDWRKNRFPHVRRRHRCRWSGW